MKLLPYFSRISLVTNNEYQAFRNKEQSTNFQKPETLLFSKNLSRQCKK